MDASMLRVLTDDALCLAGHDWSSPEFRCTLRTEALTGAPSSSTMKIGIIICGGGRRSLLFSNAE